MTTRTTFPLTHALAIAQQGGEQFQPRFIDGTKVTFDWTRPLKHLKFEWMYLKIGVRNEMVFEVFSGGD